MQKVKSLTESDLYKMELRLIKKHFPGLKPRPVKIDNSMKYMAAASDAEMLFNLAIHKSLKEIRDTLLHELIQISIGEYAERQRNSFYRYITNLIRSGANSKGIKRETSPDDSSVQPQIRNSSPLSHRAFTLLPSSSC